MEGGGRSELTTSVALQAAVACGAASLRRVNSHCFLESSEEVFLC